MCLLLLGFDIRGTHFSSIDNKRHMHRSIRAGAALDTDGRAHEGEFRNEIFAP